MSSEPAIQVEHLSKCYHIYDQPSARLKQSVMGRLGRVVNAKPRQYYREFWALRDVSFKIERGQSVGIVGRNGSGKSTLLQMICGTLSPTHGTVTTSGRIAALLELGSAFNPEFSGRENVFLNAAVLGLSRSQTAARFDEIVAFADVEEFIDQPVKTYSSGMRLRLAFSVQAQIDPDILVVDEALAVGDARFQAKCFARLRRLKENGTTILLVTHATEQIVTHCDSAILLDRGQQVLSGEPRLVVNRYLDMLFSRDNRVAPAVADDTLDETGSFIPANTGSTGPDQAAAFETHPNYNPHEYRWGDRAAVIVDFDFRANGQRYPLIIDGGAHVQLDLTVRFERTIVWPILGVTIKSKEGVTVFGTNTEKLECAQMRDYGTPGSSMTSKIAFECRLAPGDYFISLGLASRQSDGVVPHDRRYDAIHFAVRQSGRMIGFVDLDMQISNQLESSSCQRSSGE